MTEKERVTVDFDSECYYLDGEFWTSWDKYGEDMADKINDLLNEIDKSIKILTNHNKEYLHSINILEDRLKKLKELEKENEQLKKSIKRQQLSNEECSKYIIEVAKENEQLKASNNELNEINNELRHDLNLYRRGISAYW